MGGSYDDSLQNDQAFALCQGNWLGVYGKNTLIKGISFPAFLALGRFLHIPYGTLLGLFICISCIIFLLAARKIYKGRALLFSVFCLVLFCPIAWCSDAGVRIYRNVLSPWTVLAIFSCLVALFQLRQSSIKKWIPWLVSLGLSLTFAINLREDTAWTYPAIVITLLWIAIVKIRMTASGKKAAGTAFGSLRYLSAVCIPIAICLLCSGGVSLLNHHYYGIFQVNDRTQGSFSVMVENIIAIQDDAKSPRDQWFTSDMLQKALDASPSLQSIRGELIASYDAWADHFDGNTVKGDYLQWVLRDAISNAGLYQSASTAQAFSKNVTQELSDAFESGELERDSLFHPSSQGPGLSASDCIGFIPESISNLSRILSFSTIKDWFPLYTKLTDEDLAVFQYTTGLSFSNESQDSGYITFRIESMITVIYQMASPALFTMAIIALLASVIICIHRRAWRKLAPALFSTIIVLGSTLLFVFIVTIFVAFLRGTWPLQFYATPAYVLLLMFDALVILETSRTIRILALQRSRKHNLITTR